MAANTKGQSGRKLNKSDTADLDEGLTWLERVQARNRRIGNSIPSLVDDQRKKDEEKRKKLAAKSKPKTSNASASSSTPPKPTSRPSGTNVSRKKAEAKKNGYDTGLKPTTTSPKPVKATALKNQPKNFTAGPPDRMRTSGSRKAPSLDFAMPSPTYDIGSSDKLAQANRDDHGR